MRYEAFGKRMTDKFEQIIEPMGDVDTWPLLRRVERLDMNHPKGIMWGLNEWAFSKTQGI